MSDFIAGLVLGAFIIMVGVLIPFSTPTHKWQGWAIEKGHGLYCPETGDFAFVGEC